MRVVTDRDFTICGHGGGRPSTKNLNVYSTTRYNQKAENGKRKGIAEVRRYLTMSLDNEKKFVVTYKTILGRNLYSQDWREFVYEPRKKDGKYYSDCSSSGMATYNEIGLPTGGLLNTAGIHNSGRFKTVDVTIKDGHIMDPWKLRPGDCILFRGNDPSRPLQIGHVEYVYKMPGIDCEIIHKCCIYEKKDQTAKHMVTIYPKETLRIFDDCGDGWSTCTDGDVFGYIKNTNIKKVGKSSYLKGKTSADCDLHEKNSGVSRTILTMPANTDISIVTMRKNWTYVVAVLSGVKVKGWIKTKYVSYK